MTVSSSSVIPSKNAIAGRYFYDVEVFYGSKESLRVLIELLYTTSLLSQISYHIKVTCYDIERKVYRIKEVGDALEHFYSVYNLV